VAPPTAGALPHTALSHRIDSFLLTLESFVSWIWLVLLAVIVVNVIARYAFGEGRIEFEELQWHLYAIGFLVGIAAGVSADVHVRVDVLRERFSPRTQSWLELYGLLLLQLPFVMLVVFYSVPFVAVAFASNEVSVSAGGLPYRWLIKGALLAVFGLLALASFSRLLRVCAALFGAPKPLPTSEDR
jgi:TRAP-type mannitol/chloroaromatic compound transport system permease small subunit